MLCNDSPTNSGGTTNADYIATANDTSVLAYTSAANKSWTKTLPAVCSLTAAPTYQSSTNPSASNVVTVINYTSGTKVDVGTTIGLAGAWKIRSFNTNNPYSPTKSLRWGKLSLYKDTATTWQVLDEYGILFELTGVTETVSGTGVNRKVTVTATGLRYGSAVGSWGEFYWSNGLLTDPGDVAVDPTILNNNVGSMTAAVFF